MSRQVTEESHQELQRNASMLSRAQEDFDYGALDKTLVWTHRSIVSGAVQPCQSPAWCPEDMQSQSSSMLYKQSCMCSLSPQQKRHVAGFATLPPVQST